MAKATDPSPPHRRRTQAARTETTTGLIVDAARALFATKGYAGTSTTDIVEGAGVTRGALYHHFESKKDVFVAVFRQVFGDVESRVLAELRGDEQPAELVRRTALTALAEISDPGIHRILFEDADSVLSLTEIRELRGEGAFSALRVVVDQMMEAGEIERRPIDPILYMMFGGLSYLSAMVVRAEDRDAGLAAASAEFTAHIQALLGR